jgi:hypothetical protein
VPTSIGSESPFSHAMVAACVGVAELLRGDLPQVVANAQILLGQVGHHAASRHFGLMPTLMVRPSARSTSTRPAFSSPSFPTGGQESVK